MSVLIRGMEMPKAGNWKTIRIYYDGTCAEPNWQGDCKYMHGCEAVPVPKHGDLIDADKLVELCDIMADKCDGIGASIWHQFKTTVEWSPIVITAEEDMA